MNRKRLPLPALLLIIIIGLLPTPTNAQSGSVPDYKISWQAETYMTVSFSLPGWTRDMLALGPASWRVELRTKKAGCTDENSPNCYEQVATENWSTINPATTNCFGFPHNYCNGSTPIRSKWLWATGGCVYWPYDDPCRLRGVNAWGPVFNINPIAEPELYQSNSFRGNGPGMLWEPNNSGTTAFWAQGSYGYAKGNIDRTKNRSRVEVIGTMIPLSWNVEGFYE